MQAPGSSRDPEHAAGDAALSALRPALACRAHDAGRLATEPYEPPVPGDPG